MIPTHVFFQVVIYLPAIQQRNRIGGAKARRRDGRLNPDSELFLTKGAFLIRLTSIV